MRSNNEQKTKTLSRQSSPRSESMENIFRRNSLISSLNICLELTSSIPTVCQKKSKIYWDKSGRNHKKTFKEKLSVKNFNYHKFHQKEHAPFMSYNLFNSPSSLSGAVTTSQNH